MAEESDDPLKKAVSHIRALLDAQSAYSEVMLSFPAKRGRSGAVAWDTARYNFAVALAAAHDFVIEFEDAKVSDKN